VSQLENTSLLELQFHLQQPRSKQSSTLKFPD
jgi:hypothetical protein